ncbi:pyridoxal phosphate-dependent transferase [Podospora didyma]|uniref:Pyridoxal phosphate-dependent transferase n=1 Tax=Podospora didyma TaxID=330526 RepID=A0AAE0NXY1_9PEZI|nr:pyridoxal phosphate-dependent transferase [Podospora didyma]
MRGDESYGRNWGYYCLLEAFRDIFERGSSQQEHAIRRLLTGTADVEFYQTKLLTPSQGGFVNGGGHQLERPNFFIVPQGRCAETLLFSAMSTMLAQEQVKQQQDGNKPANIIISNGFFDTTGANAAASGFRLEVFTQPGLTDPFPRELIGHKNNFKGNLDLEATDEFLAKHPGQVSMILVTITNNWAAAQPVSMANIRGAAALAKRESVPLFFDACRFAENAYFIQRYEDGYADESVVDIVQEMFSYADGFTISLKKDGLANMGGVLCFRDKGVFATRYEGVGMLLKERQILCYGNDSYGGMSGRDLMTASAGLYQVTNQAYLAGRITQVQTFAQKLQANGIAVLSPPGGHAVYLDMDHFFFGCNRKPEDFASVGFTLELIKDYGIRAAEAGPFGWAYDLQESPEVRAKIPNLVRFAVPRHVYSDEHIDYTVAAIKQLYERRHTVPNAVITRGKTMRLRHFSAGLRPVPPADQAILTGTFFEEATKQLDYLALAVGQDDMAKQELTKALALATGEWGQSPVTPNPAWVSGVGNDGSPIEFSVSIDQGTGKAELRFLTEAQPTANSWQHATDAALQLNADIAASYPDSISLDRFNLIRDLFIPQGQPETIKLAAWHSCAWSPKKGPQWKLYLDPCATGSGSNFALTATREAFHRLGLQTGWELIESALSPKDSVIYFSLDLSGSHDDARVKVYIAHGGANATSRSVAARVAQMHASICPDADGFEIQRFVAAMAGTDFGLDGDDQTKLKKPLLSCFAFSGNTGERPVGTVHFPIDAYVQHDGEAMRRVREYLTSVGASAAAKERYASVLAAAQRRPLDRGRGIHAWVSLKQRSGGRRENTFYLGTEMYPKTS